jgi:hypothetical protein
MRLDTVLAAVMAQAKQEGPDAVAALAQELRSLAYGLDAFREHMTTECENKCEKCGRNWVTSCTVVEERDIRGTSYCPPCWTKDMQAGGREAVESGLANRFRYLD